jgi:hypothetical protein
MSSFAKNFLATTITSFYTEVENFLKSKNFENLPPLSEFLHYIEFEAEAKTESKKPKRSTAAPTRGKVSDSKDNKESESEEKCSFVGSRGGKCKSVAKKDYNGMCKKHFDQSSEIVAVASESGSGESDEKTEKKSKSKSKSKTTVKTGKGLSSVVSKALEDSDREDEPEVKVQSRRTKPIEESKDSDNSDKEEQKESTKKDSEKADKKEKKESAKKDSEKADKEEKKKAPAKKSKKTEDSEAEEKKSSRSSRDITKSKSAKKDSKKKDDEETKEIKPSYAPITFNRDSTSFIYDENADDGFVYKTGDFNTVYAVRHRGVAVKPTRVHVEEIKKAGKTVGVIEEDDSR